jgi:hypothetical protein
MLPLKRFEKVYKQNCVSVRGAAYFFDSMEFIPQAHRFLYAEIVKIVCRILIIQGLAFTISPRHA